MKQAISYVVATLFAVTLSAQAASQFKLIHPQDLAQLIQTGHPYIVDANTAQTRSDYGVVPGAHLLTSSASYDISKELPPNKNATLVFYCANTKCGASHSAAERAITAGYSDVSVMSDGIMGWKSAGNPTSPYQASKGKN
jgi:rhodanese-related sulfurtransferase